MISSSKPPSGLWKALALPILLAGVVLACSKEQSAPVATTKPLTLDRAMAKITIDSLDARKLKLVAFQKTIRIIGKAKSTELAKIMRDSALVQGHPPVGEVMVEGYVISDDSQVPPPPPSRK